MVMMIIVRMIVVMMVIMVTILVAIIVLVMVLCRNIDKKTMAKGELKELARWWWRSW
jgi:signal transduction histidine kinase